MKNAETVRQFSRERIPPAVLAMLPKSQLTKSQARTWGRTFTERGQTFRLDVVARFDDRCGNGHNTFAVTAELYRGREWVAGGCLHDEVARHVPELAPMLKWHLTSTDGPMHYLANTLYHASDVNWNGEPKPRDLPLARLPRLMEAFRCDVERLGMTY